MAEDRHNSPAGAKQELLYDPEVPTPSHAERARTLVGNVRTGTLCTVGLEPAGFPYGSFVTFALDGPAPVFLVSELAEHTRNLRQDTRASLLVAEPASEPGVSDPLARGRVTLIGHCSPLPDDGSMSARVAYLAAHPNAAYYADFKDFNFWRLEVQALRYIGGYGRMSWIEASAWATATPDPMVPAAAGIIAHMNQDHAAVMVEYCRAFTKATDTTRATMTGVDRYGFELSAETAAGPRPIRLGFSRVLGTADEVRQEMVALAKRARSIVRP